MRVLIWHGYLLHGTGSNEFTRGLARTLARQGHEVVVLSQDPDAADLDLGGAQAIRPPLPGRLPVFVLDRYAGMEPALLPALPRREVDDFVTAQGGAIRDAGPADLLITNHALLGGPVGVASELPFVVKVHGSELEYAMRGNPGLCQWAAETLEPARAVVVGSEHIGRVTAELIGRAIPQLAVVTPGVDIEVMKPQDRRAARAALIDEARQDVNPAGHERLPDPGNADRLDAFLDDPERTDDPERRTVVYVGKLSRQKGVHVLLDALAGIEARAVIVGFGPARPELEEQARRLGLDVLFTGPLQHRHLRHLWALADVSVVPSVFPEAFGMVAAEAASCGCPPLVARHSGLAEVAAGIGRYLPRGVRISFESEDASDLRAALAALLALPGPDRAAVSAACRRAVEELWSWDAVGERMVALGR